jgi:succinate dehydrogenase / fumarate reductase cytochrome b subunit
MAITGLLGFGFVLMHMLGNLQIYLGEVSPGIYALDVYAKNLRNLGPLLYVARLGLLGVVTLHIIAAFQLIKISNDSRPVKYHKVVAKGSDYASRTMKFSGPILLLFIIYHLLDFTLGKTNSSFVEGNVHANVVSSFSNPLISGFYIVAMLLLGLHMYHGLWSLFQSLGANNTKYNDLIRKFAVGATLVIILGNISIPISVLLGVIKK